MKTLIFSVLCILVIVCLFRVGVGIDDPISFREILNTLSENPFPVGNFLSLPGELQHINSLFEEANSKFNEFYEDFDSFYTEDEYDTPILVKIFDFFNTGITGLIQVVVNIFLCVYVLFYIIGVIPRFLVMVISEFVYILKVFCYLLFGVPLS